MITNYKNRLWNIVPVKIALFILLFMNMNIVKYMPGMIPIREAWLLIMAVCLFYICLISLIDIKQISSYEKYLYILVLMPFYSALNSYYQFKQPLVYGLLVGRESVLIATSLIIIFLYKRKKIDIDDIESSLVCVAWSTLILYIALVLLSDPSHFIGYTGFVSGQSVGRISFIFQQAIIVYGYIYYLSRALIKKSMSDFVLSVLFFSFIAYTMERALLLTVILASVYTYIRVYSLTKIIEFLPIWSIFIATFLVPTYLFFSSYIDHLFMHLYKAISVVLTGHPSGDVSADARIYEVDVVIPYIMNSPIMGNGFLSRHWHGGFLGLVGNIAPSDIGIIGIIFVFGILGLLIYLVQFYFYLKILSVVKSFYTSDVLSLSCSSFLVYFFLHSMTTGFFAFKPHIGLVFLTILFLYNINPWIDNLSSSSNYEKLPI